MILGKDMCSSGCIQGAEAEFLPYALSWLSDSSEIVDDPLVEWPLLYG